MDFIYKITTPKAGTAGNPKTTIARLTRGRLTGGFLYFPAGPAGTLHFLAKRGVHQILPFNVGQSYALDDCVVPLNFALTLAEPPFQIDLITWNTSVLYEHTLTVAIFLDPPKSGLFKIPDALNPFRQTEGYKKS